ncbi:SH2 domain-containing protein 3C-like [Sycon ciliatum]|uniref:SH2 domain-containing protein 3C-like n=1 Tax=Sycon ciliatum TaxID=27933 RepID=UPI0031F62935
MANGTTTDPLSRYEWYHGNISRDLAEQRLRFNGTFLVRKRSTQDGSYVISIRTLQNDLLHSLIVERNGNFFLQGQGVDFLSLAELIRYNEQRLGNSQSPPNFIVHTPSPGIPRRVVHRSTVAAISLPASPMTTPLPGVQASPAQARPPTTVVNDIISEEPPPSYNEALSMEMPDCRPSMPPPPVTTAPTAATGRHLPAAYNPSDNRHAPGLGGVAPPPPLQHGDSRLTAASAASHSPLTHQQRSGSKRCASACGACCAECLDCTYAHVCCCESSSACARCWHSNNVQDAVDCCCIQVDRYSCWDACCYGCFRYDAELGTTFPMDQGVFYRTIHILAGAVAAVMLFATSPLLLIFFLCIRVFNPR